MWTRAEKYKLAGRGLDAYGLHAVLSRRKIGVIWGAFITQGCYGNRGNFGEKSVVFFLYGQRSCNARWGSMPLRKTCASSVTRSAFISVLMSGGEVRTVIGRHCRLVSRSTVIVAVILRLAGWYYAELEIKMPLVPRSEHADPMIVLFLFGIQQTLSLCRS